MEQLKKKRTKKLVILAIAILAVVFSAAIAVFVITGNKDGKENKEPEIISNIDPMMLGLSDYSTYVYSEDGDEDGDGLTNAQEEKLGTDIWLADTDGDGISDYAEVNVTDTNPLKADTDRDGLKDGDEVSAGLDPNNKKTDGENKDADIVFKESIQDGQCAVELEGNAEIYSAYIEKSEITGLAKTPGVLSDVYDYHMESRPDSAEIVFTYNKRDIANRGISVENLSICQFKNGSFEVVKSQVDEDKNTVTARLKNSSKYALCNMETINTEAVPQVLLLIDNSGSMYSKEVLEESEENDVEFKRVAMAEQLIEMSGEEIKFGLAKFTGSYTLMAELGSDTDTLNEKLESIKTEEEEFNGTYIETSLMKSIDLFDKNDNEHRNFVVMLTDGYSTEGKGLFSIKFYDEDDIIKDANENNVTLIIIGLGNNVDTSSLIKMANGTDGMYIGAYNADALEQVYEKIMSAINYNLEDVDGDGTEDRVLIADSGFTAASNGFPYENYKVIDMLGQKNDGQCFGLAALSQLYYTGKLPITMDAVEDLGTGFLGMTGEISGRGYNAEGSFFVRTNGDSLVLNNVEMKKYANATLDIYTKIREIPVKDRYTNEDGYLKFSEEVVEMIDSNGLLVLKKETTSKQKYEDWEYTAYDDIYIDLYNVDEENLTESEKQSYNDFNMIFRLYAVQLEENTETFKINNANIESNGQLKAMDRLIEMVQGGIPPIISACGHAISLTRIYRDLEDSNIYTLVVYNNNEPGKEYELTVKRRKSKFALDMTEWTNDYIYTVYDKDGTYTGTKGKKIDMVIDDISWLWE